MAENDSEIEKKVVLFEFELKRYTQIRILIEDQQDSNYTELMKKIDETFTIKIYPQAKGIGERYRFLHDQYQKGAINLIDFMKNLGGLTVEMATLEAEYSTKVSNWMEKLEKSLNRATEKKEIDVSKANEIRQTLNYKALL